MWGRGGGPGASTHSGVWRTVPILGTLRLQNREGATRGPMRRRRSDLGPDSGKRLPARGAPRTQSVGWTWIRVCALAPTGLIEGRGTPAASVGTALTVESATMDSIRGRFVSWR